MKRFLGIFFLLVSVGAYCQSGFDVKELLKPRTGKQELVNDFANVLTPDQKQALESKLVAFDDSTSTQIAVVIVPNLNGNDVGDFNTELGRAWGVGGKEFNNGVILLISKEDHKLNIATGYGIEGVLPDVTAGEIINGIIVPNFKGNDFYRGIDEGTDAIMQAVQGKFHTARERNTGGPSGFKIIFIIIIIIVFLAMSSGRGGGGGSFMSRRGVAPWIIGSMLNSGRGSGGWSGGGGGWSGGGGSSGGFGGFGGGGFGGGGASGSW
ncbi:MAG: TPM domain-containing protein [Ferruginibacter sp.]